MLLGDVPDGDGAAVALADEVPAVELLHDDRVVDAAVLLDRLPSALTWSLAQRSSSSSSCETGSGCLPIRYWIRGLSGSSVSWSIGSRVRSNGMSRSWSRMCSFMFSFSSVRWSAFHSVSSLA